MKGGVYDGFVYQYNYTICEETVTRVKLATLTLSEILTNTCTYLHIISDLQTGEHRIQEIGYLKSKIIRAIESEKRQT